MDFLERQVRASVIQTLRDTSRAPAAAELASALDADVSDVVESLRGLAAAHRLALLPGTDSVWMAHPFSAVETDFVVRIGERRWFANCVWDGLSILALLGDGSLDTSSPATGEPVRFRVVDGTVSIEPPADGVLVHFLVPARDFWADIGFT